MCGIAGWVDFGRDLRTERPALEAMTATMTCRGPDAGGVWCSARAGIGHRRLSVIDIEGGAQPMRAPGDEDVVLTFSGEVYNFPELRHELRAHGHDFRTRSDTEVLLRSYLQWGAYEQAIDSQMRDVLAQPDAPLFTLVSHGKLAAAYAADPTLARCMAIQPSSTTAAAFLLDVNEWLRRYHVRIL
jgi:glutamine phosphoribosylpyrophosphate amidotransferase